MSYLMDGAAQQIRDEIKEIYDAMQALYVSGISDDNKGKLLLEKRLEHLGKELQEYEQ